MRDRPLFIPGISGAGEKATQQVESLKAGVLAQGKSPEISSYGLFCAMSLSPEVSFLILSPESRGTGGRSEFSEWAKGEKDWTGSNIFSSESMVGSCSLNYSEAP